MQDGHFDFHTAPELCEAQWPLARVDNSAVELHDHVFREASVMGFCEMHHRTHSYLLHHNLSFVSFSLREKQAPENCTVSKVIGLPVPSLSEITERAVLRKARSVSADSSHPLYDEFKLLPSARRFRTMKYVRNKFAYSFIPSASSKPIGCEQNPVGALCVCVQKRD